MSRVSRRNECWNAAQWSKSSRPAHALAQRPPPASPQAPSHHLLVPGLEVVEGGREQVRDPRCRRRGGPPSFSVARSATHSALFVVDDLPVARLEAATRANVHHDQPRRAEVAQERPALAVALLVVAFHELAQHRAGVIGLADPVPERALRELARREVAGELVDPVGHHPADHALAPPGLARHVVAPRLGDVPVVVHVVVVDHHRRRHRGEQPADHGVGPRLAVEARVLLEVGDLVWGRFGGRRRAVVDEPLGLDRDLVGVDLVAAEEEQVRVAAGSPPRGSSGRGRAARRTPGPAPRRSSFGRVYGGSCGAARGRSRTRARSAPGRGTCAGRSAGSPSPAGASGARRRARPRTPGSTRARGPRSRRSA